jgi:hypothetical protein
LDENNISIFSSFSPYFNCPAAIGEDHTHFLIVSIYLKKDTNVHITELAELLCQFLKP